jgi:hypothetical protein
LLTSISFIPGTKNDNALCRGESMVNTVIRESSDKNSFCEEHESLIRTIDILSMEILRLKCENEILLSKIESSRGGIRNARLNGFQRETLWNRVYNYYKREGFLNTIRKIISKIFPEINN